MSRKELIPHLFRIESGKLTAVLCKLLGVGHMEMAEDIVGETFLSALEVWPYKGVPENPAAWLYTVAKNKAKNHIHRHNLFRDTIRGQVIYASADSEMALDLSEQNISDAQLQMLFAICDPSIPIEAQIGLSLRILCGFGIEEIATALLTNKEAINKRLYRAKEKLRSADLAIAFPPEREIPLRLETVLTTLYLLFNEGYYSESNDEVLREDLCLEAMRLVYMLTEYPPTDQPQVNALLSLMCFHASRFRARRGRCGEMILYHDQDENLWDQGLIAQGVCHLNRASKGLEISRYHLEAGIAYRHTIKADSVEKWETILQLYNKLLQVAWSPVAALNRTYALAKANGKEEAIRAAEKINMTGNHLYYVLLGELYTGIDDDKAMQHYKSACTLARTPADRRLIERKMDKLSA